MLQKTGKNSTCSLLIVKKNAKNADHVHFKNINLRSDTELQMTFRLTFILLLLCTSSILSLGQYTYPPYRQYTLRDGLSQMQVTSLFQDSRGYIWIGTKDGLNCFNGEIFQTFRKQDGLPDNYIQSVTEDSSGNIWIATQNSLVYYDGKDIKQSNVSHNSMNLASSPDGKVWYVGRDIIGNAFFGYLADGQNHDLSNFLAVKKGNYLIKYSRDNDAVILMSLNNLYEFKNNTFRKITSTSEGNEFALFENDSTVIVVDFSLEKYRVEKIYEYREGKISLIATNTGNKLTLAGEKVSRPINLIHPYFQLIKIDQKEVQQLYFEKNITNVGLTDKDGVMWLGTEEGLVKLTGHGFETYKREYLPAIWSIIEDNQQNIWFASYGYGIKKLEGGKIIEFKPDQISKISSAFNFQAQTNGRGMMYFPNNWGIFYTNGQLLGKFGKSLSLAAYYDVTHDLLYSGGYRYIEVYDSNHRLIDVIDENDGLDFNGYISSFGSDRQGHIWFGGHTGLCCYNPENKTMKNFNPSNKNLPSDGVLCIFTDRSGKTWFGGTEGLLWYEQNTETIQKLNIEEISGTVSFVTAIDSTWLVFSQSTGIYLMNLKKFNQNKEVELFFFNENNGFLGIDPGQNGAMVDSRGNIWMTSSTEVVKLDPKKLDLKNHSVNLRLSHFNGQRLPFDQKEISLPKNDRTAIIQFEAICFNRPKAAQFSWKIGDDSEWSAWQNENYTVLTNLRDGESTLHVRTMIPGLPNSEAASSILMTVNIAVWKQEWFFPTMLALVSVLVLLSMVLFFQTRTRLIQTNKQAKMFQLQAILSQLNPHFIFNVMASLQSMILSANIEKANDYLVRMSALIRGFLDASASSGFSRSKNITATELPLKKELEILDHFIQFQQLIYPEKFDYELSLGPEIQPEKLTVPPMLIQPFVENSIKHGLLQKSGQGKLKISIFYSGKQTLTIEIEDDGIGTQKAEALMEKSHLLYTSRGKELTLKRIKLLNDMGYFIQFRTDSSERGTKVTLKIQRNAE